MNLLTSKSIFHYSQKGTQCNKKTNSSGNDIITEFSVQKLTDKFIKQIYHLKYQKIFIYFLSGKLTHLRQTDIDISHIIYMDSVLVLYDMNSLGRYQDHKLGK